MKKTLQTPKGISLLNTLDSPTTITKNKFRTRIEKCLKKSLTFNDKIEALQRYLKDKLSKLETFDIYTDFNHWQELTFINRANNYIKSYLNQDNLDDTQKRNLIYLVSICSCYRDVVVKTIKELLKIESKKEFKGPYEIGGLEINSFEELNSNREYIKDILNKYEEIEINSFSRAIRYATEESYNKSKAPEESEPYLFLGK